MKGDSSLRLTADCCLIYGCLPDCTALFGTLPRGMKTEGLAGIPLYPELRNCPAPSAPPGDLRRRPAPPPQPRDQIVQTFEPQLTPLQ